MQDDKAPPPGRAEEAGDGGPHTGFQLQGFQSTQQDTPYQLNFILHGPSTSITHTHPEPDAQQPIQENPHPQHEAIYQTTTDDSPQVIHSPLVPQLPPIGHILYPEQTFQAVTDGHQKYQVEKPDDVSQPALVHEPPQDYQNATSSSSTHQTEDSEMAHTHEPAEANRVPMPGPSSNPHGVDTHASDQVNQAEDDSNSPWSAESSQSNQTDSAYLFYQAHHGYQGTEMDTDPEEPQVGGMDHSAEDAVPPHEHDLPSSETQPESSTAQSANDVVLPDDGYYPTSLHVDSEMSDTDSALGSDIQSSTVSLRSSLYESIEENGRSYHRYKEGQYYLPNDGVEQDRLNLQHHLWTLTLDGRLHLAPVENPQSVLDIGTGTGLWALEYAERNPAATVIGTDLSAIQPEYVPPNCQFEIDDAEDEWTYNQTFDFIHGRMLFTCFQHPAEVFKRAFEATSPGGYFEMQDVNFKVLSIDGTGDGSAVELWNERIRAAAAAIGRDWLCAGKYAQYMREAGFEGVVERQFKWPSNTWPKGKKQKLLGMWSMANSLDGLGAISMALFTRAYGMTREEVEVGMVEVRKAIKDKSIHGYVPVVVVYGRKPA